MIRLQRILVVAVVIAAPAAALDRQVTARTYSARLAQLPEIQRYAALRRAINDFGQSCKRVEKAGYQGPWKNLEMWVVRCGPPPAIEYGAYLGPDGSVQVSTCADVVKVALPACRKL